MKFNITNSINPRSTAIEKLKQLGHNGELIKIAIIDGAVDVKHLLLNSADIFQAQKDETALTHHGTAVASQIVGTAIGIAPKATLISIPVFKEEKDSLVGCSQIQLAKAINTACDAKCNIINISGSSLSALGNGTQELRKSIRKAIDNNILIVAAIGNDALGSETIPASIDGVLAVGAHNELGEPAKFNNYGYKLRNKAILAPGVNIAAALKGNQLRHISGTSFAAPLVSGIAALIIRVIQDSCGNFDAKSVYKILLESTFSRSTSRSGASDRHLARCLNIDAVLKTLLQQYPIQTAHLTPQNQRYNFMENQDESHQSTASSLRSDGDNHSQNEAGSPTEIATVDTVSPAIAEESMLPETNLPALALPEIADPASNHHVHEKPQNIQVTPQATRNVNTALGADKAFVIGQVGYDFGTEARLDYFTQAMGGKGSHPYDPVEIANHLFEEKNVDQSTALTWVLKIDGIPIYAIEPEDQFAAYEYGRLVSFLHDQEKNGVERVSIAGTITGETRLFNGQIVPTISPVLRGMFNWKSKTLVSAVIKDSTDKSASKSKDKATAIEGFLNRIYYELRNRGHSSAERAINYAATNAYQMKEIFDDAISENLFLNKITAQESPVCRPDSDCWDVVLEFFNPKERLTASRKLYRYTVDVSDIMPVTVGDLRSWHAY